MKSRVSLSIICLGFAAMGAQPLFARPPAPPLEQDVGPGGDYPVLIGDPFVVDGATFTPADTMNYDAVGYAAPSAFGGTLVGVSGAHRTLPIPSYVEVTALDTGRTTLVRLEQRGPMSGSALIALSDTARELIGILPDARAAVRVRRVNPPEQERALLRTGQAAPLRMDTPPGLLTALRRKLGAAGAPVAIASGLPAMAAPVNASPVVAAPAKAVAIGAPQVAPKIPAPKPAAAKPAKPEKPAVLAKSSAVSKPAEPDEPMASVTKKGALFVQVGAYASRANALAAAKRVGGSVAQAGKVWRVRMGQGADRKEADAALAKARAAGYADARIQTER